MAKATCKHSKVSKEVISKLSKTHINPKGVMCDYEVSTCESCGTVIRSSNLGQSKK